MDEGLGIGAAGLDHLWTYAALVGAYLMEEHLQGGSHLRQVSQREAEHHHLVERIGLTTKLEDQACDLQLQQT